MHNYLVNYSNVIAVITVVLQEKGPQGEIYELFSSSKYVKYEMFDKCGIIAILSSHNPEVKHMHTPMPESAH